MNYDAILVGGSYAGMAAALQLLRARRNLLILDAGKRRNRTASHAHGFLTQDGVDPAELARTARAAHDVSDPDMGGRGSRAGDGRQGRISGDKPRADLFRQASCVRDRRPGQAPRNPGSAGAMGAKRLQLPALPRVRTRSRADRCHRHGPDVSTSGPARGGMGRNNLLPEHMLELDGPSAKELAHRGVRVESISITRIEGSADVVLSDGRVLSFAGLFTAPQSSPASPSAEQLGCKLVETPMGTQIWTSDTKETSISGAFACGDVARVPHTLSLVVADGAMAGAQLHRSLVWLDG